MTPAELVALATELKAIGVKSFSIGEVGLEFFEAAESFEPIDVKDRETLPATAQTAVDKAAHLLMNRGRA